MRSRILPLAILLSATLAVPIASAAEPLTIRTGWVVATSGYSPLLLEKKELLRHFGTSYILDPHHFRGTAPQLTALAGNEIDIATIAYSTLALAVLNAKMEDIRIVADGFQDGVDGHLSTPFMVRNDSGIKTIEDLKGKVVASNAFGGAYDVAMRSMLRQHHLEDKRDYTVIESDFAHMSVMLLERKSDLVIGSMPFSIEPDMRANAHALFTQRDAVGRTQMIMMAARAGFIEKNRAALEDFFEDMLASFRWFHDPANRAQAIAMVARVTKQPVARLDAYLYSKNDFYYDRDGLPDLDALQRNVDTLRALGIIKGEVDVKKYADLSFVAEAARRLK